MVLVAVVPVVAVVVLPDPVLEPELEPLALNEPVSTIAPPVTLIEPVDPPVVETAPPTVTAWAVAVI